MSNRFQQFIFLYIIQVMKTIKVVNSPTGKSVKKILLNRSRSGNLMNFNTLGIQSRQNISPARNNIGMKNPERDSEQKKENLVSNQLNSEYYQNGNQVSSRVNLGKASVKGQVSNIRNIQKKPIIKEKQLKNYKDQYGCFSTPNTAENSQFSITISNGLRNIEPQHRSGYLSPSIKLKKLEMQKCFEKKKVMQKMEKMIKTQELMEETRTSQRLQIQLYQQIIKKLQRQSIILKSTVHEFSNNNSSLKNSKSGETEEGESSNQL